jgi:hypothetical protein
MGDTAQISTAVNLATDTIKLMLVAAGTWTPSADADVFIDDGTANDAKSNEVAASGTYSAGGATLTITGSTDDTDDEGVFDATDVSFTSATITARYAVVYKSTGVDATSPIIAVIDFGSNQTSTAGTFAITFASEGILNLG